MSTGLWIPSEELRPEECRCIWTSDGPTAGWWRHYTRPTCPLHGTNSITHDNTRPEETEDE